MTHKTHQKATLGISPPSLPHFCRFTNYPEGLAFRNILVTSVRSHTKQPIHLLACFYVMLREQAHFHGKFKALQRIFKIIFGLEQ
jgi:hypothetical protein